MKALLINSVCGIGSTGRICVDIAKKLETDGYQVKIAYGRSCSDSVDVQKFAVRIGNDFYEKVHGVLSRIFDLHGCGSKGATKRFIKWADSYDPDLLWLHNIHGYYINYQMLFDWIKSRPQMRVKWTFHDCWPFTGHCTYFTMAGCNKWKNHCSDCPQKKSYPKCLVLDNSYNNYEMKKKAFTGVNDLEIITPSVWLANLVKESYLKDYQVTLCNNTIDTDVFKPTNSNVREDYGIGRRKMVLGVASEFGKRKGLHDFIKLSEMLSEEYVIVLVGLSKQEMKTVPDTIIKIRKTNCVQELVTLYSAADVYVNATYEDNYPTTNLEAQACGTPCITYASGGSPESVPAENVVETGNIVALHNRICEVCSDSTDLR